MTTTTVQALYAFRGIYGDCGEDEAERFADSYCWRKLAREAFAESAYTAEPTEDCDHFFIFLSV